jgi:putative membrane protein
MLIIVARSRTTSLESFQPLLVIFPWLVFSLGIERIVLAMHPLAIVRRLMAISYLANGIWLVLSLLGLLLETLGGGTSHFLSLFSLGLFFAIGFRTMIFGSAICSSLLVAFLLAFIQPALLASFISLLNLQALSSNIIPYLAGCIFVISVASYIVITNRASRDQTMSSLTLLRAFLEAWAADRPELMERIVEGKSTSAEVRTRVLSFDTEGPRRPAIVVSDVHPGPFAPVGSSNLPYQLYEYFTQEGYSPLVLHSFSSHDLNLPSRSQVSLLIESLHNPKAGDETRRCTRVLSSTYGRAIVKGINFNGTVLMTITLAPHGMEDFPRSVGEEIEQAARTIGFKDVILVDSHNSQDDLLGEDECSDVVKASNILLKQLKDSSHYTFRVGFCHSSEFGLTFHQDVGPGGIGVILLEVDGVKNLLIGADANNAVVNLRDRLFTNLQGNGLQVMEICTSDTHVTSGKVKRIRGYFPLGELTSLEALTEAIRVLSKKAEERLQNAKMVVSTVNTKLKVMGEQVITDFSKVLDRTSSIAKKGAQALAIEVIALLLIISIL